MDYEKDLVSVVIPTHNREKWIQRAVLSAAGQTYSNLEIIVVSDGSEDRTDEIVKELEKSDKRIQYISYRPGHGGNYARNMGIKAAHGEWIAFLDDDDEWHEDKIEKQLALAEKHQEYGLICTAVNTVYDDTGRSSVFIPQAPEDSSKDVLLRNAIGSTTTVMVKHDLLIDVGMFDEALPARQDYDLWIRLCQITKVGIVKEPCVEYHNLVSNQQISWNYGKYADAMRIMAEKYADLRESKLSPEEINLITCNERMSLARKALKCGDRSISRKMVKEAMQIRFQGKQVIYYIASFFPFKFVVVFRNLLS